MAATTTTQTTPPPTTATQQQSQEQQAQQRKRAENLVLRLVPRRKKAKGVRWTEDTVDNEFAGKKSSKKCCIFHRRRQFGDWSDDEDSDAEGSLPKDCGQQQREQNQPPQLQPQTAQP